MFSHRRFLVLALAVVAAIVALLLVSTSRESKTTNTSGPTPIPEKTSPDLATRKHYYAYQLADGFVVKVGNKVTFLDRDAQIRSQVNLPPGSYFSVSRGGRYVAWCEPAEYNGKGIRSGPGTMRMLSSRGQQLWSISTKEVPVPFFLGESGKLLSLGITDTGKLLEFMIIGPRGVEKTMRAPWTGSMSTAMAASEQGTHFVLMDGSPATVMLYDDQGNRLYQTNLEGRAWGLRIIQLSEQGALSVLAMTDCEGEPGHYSIWRLDEQGNVAWRVRARTPGNRHIDVSNNSKMFVTYATDDRIECYDLEKGELLWRWDEGVRNRAVLKTVFSPDDRYLLASASWYEWDRPEDRRSDGPRRVFLFDASNGHLLWKREFDGKNYEGEWERSPMIRFRGENSIEVFDMPNQKLLVCEIRELANPKDSH